jgi:hypothetical protein
MSDRTWLDDCDLTVRTCNVLYEAGLVTPEAIRAATDRELLTRKNMGRRCLDELRSRGLRPDSCEASGCVLVRGHEGMHVPYASRYPARGGRYPPRGAAPPVKVDPYLEVARERERQVEKWGDRHDDAHRRSELALAAAMLALPVATSDIAERIADELSARGWDDAEQWLHKHMRKGRRRQLVTAAALVVAEIERLDRIAGVT